MNIDLLAFPGHKGLLGPQGIGGLFVRDGIKLKSLMQGGTGSNSEYLYQPEIMPDAMESGTVNTPGIVGLNYGIGFINSIGIDNIRATKDHLTNRLYEGLKDIKKVILYSRPESENNSGVIAANFEGIDSTEISYILDKIYDIATRAGLHCAPLAHESLNTMGSGIVRFSPGGFNTLDEIDLVIKAMQEISMHI